MTGSILDHPTPTASRASDAAAEQAQRSALVGQALRDLGLQVAQPSGSYYVVADFSPLFDRYGATTSAEMSRALIEQAGLALLPLSAFAAPENQELYAGWMRVAACKRESTLQEGMDRLAAALR